MPPLDLGRSVSLTSNTYSYYFIQAVILIT